MSDEEKAHLDRIDVKLDDISELLTETRIAVARIEIRPVQEVLTDHEQRLANLEALRNWFLGVAASCSLIAFLCWDFLKIWIKK